MITEVDLSGTPCFAPGATLKDLKKVNFIFGFNGSGKTTLTRALADNSTNGNNDTHVYNCDYISNVFFPSPIGNPGELPGITFTLGSKDAEKQKELQERIKEVTDLEAKLEGTSSKVGQKKQLEEADEEVEAAGKQLHRELKKIWSQYSAADTLLKGYKRDVERLISKLVKHKDKEKEILSLSELSERYMSLNNNEMVAIQVKLPFELPSITWFRTLQQKLAIPIDLTSDSALFPLAEELNLLPWIKEGFEIASHNDKLSTNCPYCQQHMSDELKEQIRLLFETQAQREISNLSEALKRTAALERELRNSVTTISSSQIAQEESVATSLQTLSQLAFLLDDLAQAIESKISNPQTIVSTHTTITSIDDYFDHIQTLNERIDEHNSSINNRREKKQQYENRFYVRLYQDTESIIVDKYYKGLLSKRKKADGIRRAISETDTRIKELNSHISELRDQLSDTTEVRNSINETLRHLGFVRFRLGQSPTNNKLFTIERPSDNNPLEYLPDRFETLSEGEKTILSFLYFMHCIKPDSNELSEKRSVSLVIDDPIASTDTSTFYFITALMRRAIRRIIHPGDTALQNELSHKVDQAIILTHNVGFYSNASFEIRRQLNNEDISSKVAFYKLEKSYMVGKPHDIQLVTNPNSISTEYQLLWNEVFDAYQACAHKPKDAIISEFKLLPNTLRRILDSYFITLGSTNYSDKQHSTKSSITRLGQSYGEVVEECMIRLNEGSHGSYENYISSTLPTRQLLLQFEQIFETRIDNGAHHGHFLMMMGLPAGGHIQDLWNEIEQDTSGVCTSS